MPKDSSYIIETHDTHCNFWGKHKILHFYYFVITWSMYCAVYHFFHWKTYISTAKFNDELIYDIMNLFCLCQCIYIWSNAILCILISTSKIWMFGILPFDQTLSTNLHSCWSCFVKRQEGVMRWLCHLANRFWPYAGAK